MFFKKSYKKLRLEVENHPLIKSIGIGMMDKSINMNIKQYNEIHMWTGFLQWDAKIITEETPYKSALKALEFLKEIE